MTKNTRIMFMLITVCFLYVSAGIMLNAIGTKLYLSWLFWNLFLGVIPMILAYFIHLLYIHKNQWIILIYPLLLLWLLFLPNSCYMITDLIHIEGSELIGSNGLYIRDLKDWINLLYICAGIFLAVISGLFSVSLIHQPLKIRFSKAINFTWIALISILCGYGVFIGRFLRLNSWDILNPISLINILYSNIDRFTILFTFFIGAFFFFGYLIFDCIISNN